MPKFQAGDKIMMANGPSLGTRTVIGYQSNGYVVYEYEEYPGKAPTLHAASESSFNLVPKIRKGWICVREGSPPGSGYFVWGKIHESEAEAIAQANSPFTSKHVAVVEIEFEEKA